eukprot:469472-Prorocentrum_minimum.AAC.3
MVSWTRSRLAELDPGGDDEVVAEFVASLQRHPVHTHRRGSWSLLYSIGTCTTILSITRDIGYGGHEHAGRRGGGGLPGGRARGQGGGAGGRVRGPQKRTKGALRCGAPPKQTA